MAVLVATNRTQGERANDFNWCLDGEPLRLMRQCSRDYEVDGECGCKRAFAGIVSGKGTTTAVVVRGGHRGAIDASAFPVGSVVELRGDILVQRHGIITMPVRFLGGVG